LAFSVGLGFSEIRARVEEGRKDAPEAEKEEEGEGSV